MFACSEWFTGYAERTCLLGVLWKFRPNFGRQLDSSTKCAHLACDFGPDQPDLQETSQQYPCSMPSPFRSNCTGIMIMLMSCLIWMLLMACCMCICVVIWACLHWAVATCEPWRLLVQGQMKLFKRPKCQACALNFPAAKLHMVHQPLLLLLHVSVSNAEATSPHPSGSSSIASLSHI